MSLNQCNFIGHVGKDPEIRKTQGGDPIANFSLACSERWRDKATGEQKEKTEWIRVTAFGNVAGIIEKYVKSGSKLYVSGKMQTRKWVNKDGVDQYTTEIVLQGFDSKLELLSPKDQAGGGAQSRASDAGGYAAPSAKPAAKPAAAAPKQSTFIDDEIPFAPEVR
jgi:single-strand DNA-binding protein